MIVVRFVFLCVAICFCVPACCVFQPERQNYNDSSAPEAGLLPENRDDSSEAYERYLAAAHPSGAASLPLPYTGMRLNDTQCIGHGCVAARRVIALGMKKGSLKGEQLHNALRTYASMYRGAIKSISTIYMLHVSKSGGSFACMCAQENKCTAPGSQDQRTRMDTNCHAGIQNYKTQWWGAEPPKLKTCNSLSEMNRQQKWMFVGDESYMISSGPCPQFFNVIIMREPINRIISHLHHVRNIKQFKAVINFQGLKMGYVTAKSLTPAWLLQNMRHLADNYYIRSLLGFSVFSLPVGQVNHTHFLLAKEKLEQFDVILRLEELTNQISRTLGFTCSGVKGRSSAHGLKVDWTPKQFGELGTVNKYDKLLYEYSERLMGLDFTVFGHAMFGNANVKSCPNNRCGFLCNR